MKNIMRYKKLLLALFIIIVGISAAARYVSADNINILFDGAMLNDGSWEVGDTPVTWTASAFDRDNDTGLPEELDADSYFTWQSSDPTVVRITPQSSGVSTASKITLTPVSSGTATITATYTKNYIDDDGNPAQKTATASRQVKVKFRINNKPSAPYEDTDVISDIYTNSVNDVIFKSSNENVAIVTTGASGSGKVTLKGAGYTTITATLNDGQKDTCRIAVNSRITESDPILTVRTGDTHDLSTNAIVNNSVNYFTANANIAKIDAYGKITGVNAGKTYVSVEALKSNDEWYSLQPDPRRSIRVNVPFVITNAPVLNVGDTATLKTNVADEYKGQISWNSSDTTIVEVTQDGKITAKKSGTAKIYATIVNEDIFEDLTPQNAEVTVTVIDTFALSKSELSVQAGSEVKLEALVTDESASVEWSSSNSSVAAVSTSAKSSLTANVKGIRKGVAIITATQTVNGVSKKASCYVNVTEPVQSIDVTPKSVNIDKGDEYQLNVTFTPILPDNTKIKWESSDTTVVKVDDNGKIKGINGGSAVVWVITEDGIKVSSCDVYVRVPVTGITLSENKISESKNAGTHQLSAYITPSGGYSDGINTNVEWSVSPSDGSIIRVDNTGLITYVSPGSATVIAKTVDGGYMATCQVEVLQPVTSITVDNKNLRLKIDDTYRLSAEVLPVTATDRGVKWESSDSSIVTVDSNGFISAKKTGNATILAKTVDGGYTDMCNVTVYQPVTSVSISNSNLSVRKGSTAWISAIAVPETSENKKIVYSSSDTSIATIDPNSGMITAIEAGTCTLIATSQDTGVSAKCTLTVTQAVTGIELDSTRRTILKGEQYALSAIVSPIDAENRSVKFTSSNPQIATVDENGVVTAILGGQAVITATTVERGLTASCLVTVQEFVTSVKMNGMQDYLNKGQKISLSADVLPTTASNQRITWKSSKANIISVDNNGVATALDYGKATIYAYASDNSSVFDMYTMVVDKPIQKIKFSNSSIELERGKNKTLKPVLTPTNPTFKNLEWSSSDESIVTVNENGIVSAIASGRATILCTSKRYGVTGTCTINVKEYVDSIKLVGTVDYMLKGGKLALKTEILPTTATNQKIKWKSSNSNILNVDSKGLVTAKDYGKATIYAYAKDGSSAFAMCTIIVERPVKSISFKNKSVTLESGKKITLKPIFNPKNATFKDVEWSSTDTSVATVTENGIVYGVGSGKTTIICKSLRNGVVGKCTVNVKEYVKSITITQAEEYVKKGSKFSLVAEVTPSTATNTKVRWKSSDSKVLKVNSQGKVYAKGYGKATIYAYAKDGSGVYAMTNIIVERPIKSIKFKNKNVSISKGSIKTLKPIINPKNATFKDIEWVSTNTAVATVDSTGLVTALSSGSTTILCKSVKYGITGKCNVNVKEYVEKLKISGLGKRHELGLGSSKILKAVVTPDTASNKNVIWSSSNSGVITVDSNGIITGVGLGTATITATAADGKGAVASIGLTVIKPVANISVTPSSMTLLEGRTGSVMASVSPADATYTGVKWKTSDSAIATVDNAGSVTAISAGSCTVSAISLDGNSVQGRITVNVKPFIKATSVVLSSTSLTMLPGQSRKVNVNIKPANTTESISWTTSDASVATVDGNGMVTARGQGTATIYAISSETGLESSCQIVVLALNATAITLEQYDSYDLDVFGCTEKISWYSNNKRVATVDANGKVVARMAGRTTITAKVNGKVLYCTVTVRSM